MKINLKSLSMFMAVSLVAFSAVEAGKKRSRSEAELGNASEEPSQKEARTWSQWASQKAAANFSTGNARIIANQKLQEGNAAVASQQAEAAQAKANKMVDAANQRAADARAKAREAARAEIAKRQKEIESLQGQDRELRVQTVPSDARKFRQQDDQATIDQKRAERAARKAAVNKPAPVVRRSAESPF